jgi:hypothetical protein
MKEQEKNTLKHDLLNSIVILNSISRSASGFMSRFLENKQVVTDKQIAMFKQAIESIPIETAKIEKIFQSLSMDLAN